MKLIGLLGGTSWPSTPLYFERLNRHDRPAMPGRGFVRAGGLGQFQL